LTNSLTGFIIGIYKDVNGFYMAMNKGGRGIKAPYETTHVRVPVPIKDKVQKLIDDYKNNLETQEVNQQDNEQDNNLIDFDEAIALAHQCLIQKKSARLSLQKLLTGIYGKKVSL
jgi:hypothetical protein